MIFNCLEQPELTEIRMATEDDTSSEMALATQKLARFPKHGWTVGHK